VLCVGLAGGEHRAHVQPDKDHQPRRRFVTGWPSLPDRKRPGGGGKAPVHLEGVGPLGIGHLAPLGGLCGGQTAEVQIAAVVIADPGGIAVGQNQPGGVGDDEVIDARLLRRFDQKFLEAKGVPLETRAGARPGLEGADQSLAFFQQQAGRFRSLPVQALHGHDDKEGHQHHRRSDDEPGRDKRP